MDEREKGQRALLLVTELSRNLGMVSSLGYSHGKLLFFMSVYILYVYILF